MKKWFENSSLWAVLIFVGTLWDCLNVLRHVIDGLFLIMTLILTRYRKQVRQNKENSLIKLGGNSLLCMIYFWFLLYLLPCKILQQYLNTPTEYMQYYLCISLFFMVTLSSFDCMILLRRYMLLVPFLLLAKRKERGVIFQGVPQGGWGKFKPYAPKTQRLRFSAHSSPIEACWLHGEFEDRDMELTNSLQFVDSRGAAWIAKKGLIIDGASIPKLFWNTIGPPYVGTYRNASVVHDAYCEDHPRTGEQAWLAKLYHRDSTIVHRMFYEAMRADHETGGAKSANLFTRWNEWVLDTIIYLTVSIFGPRWRCE